MIFQSATLYDPGLYGKHLLWSCFNGINWNHRNGDTLCSSEVGKKLRVSIPAIRYRVNHIGLGTKKFVDSLGGC